MYNLPGGRGQSRSRGQFALRDLHRKAADKLYMSASLDGSVHKSTKQDGQPLLQMFAAGWSNLFWSITLSETSLLNCSMRTWQYDELLARTKALWKINTDSGEINYINLHERAGTTETVKNGDTGKHSEIGGTKNTKNLPIMSPAIASLGFGEVKGYTGIPLKQKKQWSIFETDTVISLKIMTNHEVICQYWKHGIHITLVTNFSSVSFQLGTG